MIGRSKGHRKGHRFHVDRRIDFQEDWVGNTNPEYEKSIALYQGRVDRAEFPSPAASSNRCKSDHPGSFCESTTDQHVRYVKGVGLPEMSMDFSIFWGKTAATSPKTMF